VRSSMSTRRDVLRPLIDESFGCGATDSARNRRVIMATRAVRAYPYSMPPLSVHTLVEHRFGDANFKSRIARGGRALMRGAFICYCCIDPGRIENDSSDFTFCRRKPLMSRDEFQKVLA